MCCVVCAASLTTCCLFTVCPLGLLHCVCSVLGHLALDHRCARLVCCVVCVVSWAAWRLFTGVPVLCCVCLVFLATWRLFTGVRAWCVEFYVRCPWPLSCSSPLCTLGVLCVPRPWPLGACSPVWAVGVYCVCLCGVPGNLALVHQCACLVCCAVCALSLATWRVFTGVHAQCVVCVVSFACWRLFTVVRPWCGMCVVSRRSGRLFPGVLAGCVV